MISNIDRVAASSILGIKLKRRLIDSMARRSFDSHRRRTSFNVAKRVKRWRQRDKKEKKRWNHATSVVAGPDKNDPSLLLFARTARFITARHRSKKPAPAKRQMKNEICSWSRLANPRAGLLVSFSSFGTITPASGWITCEMERVNCCCTDEY